MDWEQIKSWKKRWSKSYQKKSQELPIFETSQLVLISILIFNGCHFMTLDDLRSKTIQPAEVFGSLQNAELDMESLESRYRWWHDTTRHEFFQSGRCWMTWKRWKAVCQWQHGRGWLNRWNSRIQVICSHEDQKDPVLRLDFNGQFLIFFWIVLDTSAATSITTVSCTSCICHPSAPIPTFASPYDSPRIYLFLLPCPLVLCIFLQVYFGRMRDGTEVAVKCMRQEKWETGKVTILQMGWFNHQPEDVPKKCSTGIDWFDFGDFASRPGVKHLLEADLAWLLRSAGLLWNSDCHMKLQE